MIFSQFLIDVISISSHVQATTSFLLQRLDAHDATATLEPVIIILLACPVVGVLSATATSDGLAGREYCIEVCDSSCSTCFHEIAT